MFQGYLYLVACSLSHRDQTGGPVAWAFIEGAWCCELRRAFSRVHGLTT